MPRLKKIAFSEFRAIYETQTVPVAVPNGKPGSGLTVIVGANNSGKSTVLDALLFLQGTRKRFTEEQIIGVLKEAEAGLPTKELVRKYGVTEQTYYRWKSKFGGMEVNEAKRLRGLEDENRRLKHLVADLSRPRSLPSSSRKSRHSRAAGSCRMGSCSRGAGSAAGAGLSRSWTRTLHLAAATARRH
jgi:putative transposase